VCKLSCRDHGIKTKGTNKKKITDNKFDSSKVSLIAAKRQVHSKTITTTRPSKINKTVRIAKFSLLRDASLHDLEHLKSVSGVLQLFVQFYFWKCFPSTKCFFVCYHDKMAAAQCLRCIDALFFRNASCACLAVLCCKPAELSRLVSSRRNGRGTQSERMESNSCSQKRRVLWRCCRFVCLLSTVLNCNCFSIRKRSNRRLVSVSD
jgi:hypothetical protein